MTRNTQIRTRFAPSPTGFLHIGGLRSALTNYLFAKKYDGQFILRLEDTDQERLVKDSVKDIIDSLNWAGLKIDEGVIGVDEKGEIVEKGEKGPYVQSKRLKIYQKYAKQLVNQGDAYYCFCSSERLNEMRKQQQKQGEAPMYDRECYKLSDEQVKTRLKRGQKHVIRLKIPRERDFGAKVAVSENKNEGFTSFDDMVRGPCLFQNKLIDDQVLIKSDGFPTYHLAVVVDDYEMEIPHVFRGEEWLPSTAKHIILWELLGWKDKMPKFGHLPQLLNLNGKKLSKRDGDVSVRDFYKKGYLPEAILNYIALLGWNPKTTEEIFSLKDLEERFDEKKLNKAGARFDYKRLDWFSNYYIKQLEDKEYLKILKNQNFLENLKLDYEKAAKIALIQKERISKLGDVFLDIDYLIYDLEKFEKNLLGWKKMTDDEIKQNLQKAKEVIEKIDKKYFSSDRKNLEKITEILLEVAGENRGEFLWPLRVALTGKKQSVSPFECVWVLGKEKSIQRINKALALI
ncbi:MAG: glutamate--tRNA ligase [Candidatus Moranbacteria bacterium]|nr:glutamate--tRNA ligase [Candidatus Moranbacteria bacterium]